MFRLYALAACVAAVGAAYGIGRIQGHASGQAACEARVAAERQQAEQSLFATADELSEALADNRTLERRLAASRREFESSSSDDCTVDPDGLRRLEQRLGVPNP